MNDTKLHNEPEEQLIDNSPNDKKYTRLYAKILGCQIHFSKQDLDEIISIVKQDFPEPINNY
jgi:hypothetical protein